jgi:hypothetical protein
MHANLKLGLLTALLLGGAAGAVKLGDTRLDVVADLGAPTGFVRCSKEETLYYERGTVQLLNGKVVNFEIISTEQLRERKAAEEKTRAALLAKAAEQRAQLKTEGESVLAKLLTAPDFVNAGAAVQVARWREFMKKYPDVPVAEYYLPTLKRYEEEQAQQARDQRIADLEKRVQDAEQRVLMSDTRQMQYPSLYIIQPSMWYRPPCGINGAPRREHPHGPLRSSVGGLTGNVSFSF